MTLFPRNPFLARARRTLLPLLLVAAGAAGAQELTPEASRQHAERALDLLLDQGDRRGAVAEALRALPQPPQEADLDAWPEAWNALYRAMASRSLTIASPDERDFFGTLNPDGTRALVSWLVDGSVDSTMPVGAILVDTLAGSNVNAGVVAPEPVGEGYFTTAPVAFSPDGSLGAVALMNGETVVIDGVTGDEKLRVPSDAVVPRFSPDNRHLMTHAMGGSSVWDLSSGAEALALTGDRGHSFDWSHDGRILAARVSGSGAADLLLHGLDGIARTLVPGLEGFTGGPIASPTQPAFLVGRGSQTLVYDLDGNQTAEIDGDFGLVRFTRDGTALAVLHDSELVRASDTRVEVYGLDGTPLETTPADHMPFDHQIYSPDGEPIGSLAGPAPTTYFGQDLPEGMALYQAALALVGEGAVTAPDAPTVDGVDEASTAFARAAERMLMTGDRAGAIVAALKGLPAEPAEADFERFAAAHLLLYRSIAGRPLRLPGEDRGDRPAVVSPTGGVMAVGGPRAALYAMPGGTLITELTRNGGEPVPVTTYPYFTADGTVLAVAESDGVVMRFIDGRSGAGIAEVTVPVPDWQRYLNGYSSVMDGVGFSPDERRFLLDSPKGYYVISLDDWSVTRLPLPERRSFDVSWRPEGGFLVVERLREEPGPAAAVFHHDGSTMTKVFDLPRDPQGLRDEPGGMQASPYGGVLIAESDGRQVVFGSDGTLLGALPDTDGYFALVRDGTAAAMHDEAGRIEDSLQVFSLETGERLETAFSDYPLLDQMLFDMDGEVRQFDQPSFTAHRYRASEVPMGAALVAQALEGLSDEERAEVERERIAVE